MNKRIKELVEKRNKLTAEARQYQKEQIEKGGFTEETRGIFDKMFLDADALKKEIADEMRLAELEKEQRESEQPRERRSAPGSEAPNTPGTGEIEYRGQKFAIDGHPDLVARTTEEFRDGFDHFLRTGEMRSTVQAGVAEKGGVLSPTTLSAQFYNDLDQENYIRGLADHEFVVNGGSLGNLAISTGASDAEWTPEIPASDIEGDSAMRMSSRELDPHDLAKLATVSKKAIYSSARSPVDLVMGELRRIWGNTEQKAFLTGDGNKKPLGIFTASNDGIPTSQDVTAAGITYDGLVEAKYAVPEQYRGSATWEMHRDAVMRAAKLTDSQDRPIWQASLAAGQPDTILGKAVHESEFCPNTFTAGNYVAAFGSWKQGYKIADSLAMAIQVLIEKFALKNQIGYLAYGQTDGAPMRARAFSRVKHS